MNANLSFMSLPIRIVLVATTHPGNIGAAARAMKTMGLSSLYLVTPKYFPHGDATIMSSGADDILMNATVTQSLEEALSGCHLVFGTSARLRTLPLNLCNAREAAEKIIAAPKQQIAIVFGREHAGLTNEELLQCHYHVHIPTITEFSSLNVAQAVQIMSYEIRMASLTQNVTSTVTNQDLATEDEIQGFLSHIKQTVIDIDFIKSTTNIHSIMKRIHRLFHRTQLEKSEVHILRGFLKAVQRKIISSKNNGEVNLS